MDSKISQAVYCLDDLVRRLSSPGATCTADELRAIADLLRGDAAPAGQADVAAKVEALQAEVAALASDVSAPVAQPAA